MSAPNSDIILGIDLGTTNTLVAVMKNGNPEVLYNYEGELLTKSCVSFTDTEILIGSPAIQRKFVNLPNTVYGVKRLIGRDFDDVATKEFIKTVQFDVINQDNQPMIKVMHKKAEKTLRPLEVSCLMLKKMREIAEKQLGLNINRAVITVPAYFGQQQKLDTIEAAKLAGFKDPTGIHLLPEPSAAAYHYGFKKDGRRNGHTLLVFDFGGGTFDVSIIKLENGREMVKGVGGDRNLGGRDFDNALADYLVAQIKERYDGKDFFSNEYMRQKLFMRCEDMKIALSSADEYDICMVEFDNMIFDNIKVMRDDLDRVCGSLMQKAIDETLKTLTRALMQPPDIDEVLLVGGTTRIPKLKLMLIQAGFNSNWREQIVETQNKELVVASGAAIYASCLDGMPRDQRPIVSKVTEVAPLSIGTGIIGNKFFPLIYRNTPLPCIRSTYVPTGRNYQTSMHFTIVEGERKIVTKEDFNTLGRHSFNDLPADMAGNVSVKLTMEMDTNGILKTTIENGTREEFVTIDRNNSRFPSQGVGEVVNTAAINRNDDIIECQRLQAKNNFKKELETVLFYEEYGSDIYELCKEYHRWIKENSKETKEKFNDKLREFNMIKNAILSRRNLRF